MSDEQWSQFESLNEVELKTSRAWAIREQFRWFWEYRYAGDAMKFFARWYSWASRSRIQSIKSAARGFRNFENYRTRILFFCSKLQLMPAITH